MSSKGHARISKPVDQQSGRSRSGCHVPRLGAGRNSRSTCLGGRAQCSSALQGVTVPSLCVGNAVTHTKTPEISSLDLPKRTGSGRPDVQTLPPHDSCPCGDGFLKGTVLCDLPARTLTPIAKLRLVGKHEDRSITVTIAEVPFVLSGIPGCHRLQVENQRHDSLQPLPSFKGTLHRSCK